MGENFETFKYINNIIFYKTIGIKKFNEKYRDLFEDNERKSIKKDLYNWNLEFSNYKKDLDYILNEEFQKIHKLLDPFKNYKNFIKTKYNAQNVSNAWLKMYEILMVFKIGDYYKDKHIKVFFNCEFPGSFIFGFNHYIRTLYKDKTYDWVGNSYIDFGAGYLDDRYGLYKKYRKHWFMNSNFNGDITNLKNIEFFEKHFETNKVDLYTSDGAILCEDYKEEETNSIINLCQFYIGLLSLKPGGILIVKHFSLFTTNSIVSIYLLSYLFDKLYTYKPISSREFNDELYTICVGFKNNFNGRIKEMFYDLIVNHKISYDIPDYISLSFLIKYFSQYIFIKRNTQYKLIKTITKSLENSKLSEIESELYLKNINTIRKFPDIKFLDSKFHL